MEEIEKMNNYFENILNQRKESIKMSSNDDYIIWLENFTSKYSKFSDDDWLYCPEKISEIDQNNVKKLNLFFDGIETYASKNYIYPTPNEWGSFYSIKYNDVGYNIGLAVGQGVIFYCERTQVIDGYLDFMDIINDKKQKNSDSIRNELDKLSQSIKNLINNGIPIPAIIDTFEANINEVKSVERPKVKIKDKPKI